MIEYQNQKILRIDSTIVVKCICDVIYNMIEGFSLARDFRS